MMSLEAGSSKQPSISRPRPPPVKADVRTNKQISKRYYPITDTTRFPPSQTKYQKQWEPFQAAIYKYVLGNIIVSTGCAVNPSSYRLIVDSCEPNAKHNFLTDF